MSQAAALRVDPEVAARFWRDSGFAYNRAKALLDQFVVDLEEARLLDQARLESEETARAERARQQAERERNAATSEVVGDYPNSELLVRFSSLRARVALAEPDKAVRSLLIELLKLEKRALAWYEAPTRAFVRSRVHLGSMERFSATDVQEEVTAWKTLLFSMPTQTASSAPAEFLRCLDMETLAAKGVSSSPATFPRASSSAAATTTTTTTSTTPSGLLGASKDVAIEVDDD